MGYDLDRFAGGVIDNELLCSVCSSVLEDPVEAPCQHFFCGLCIKRWLEVSDICPTDRQPLRAKDLKQPSRLLCNLLARLEIKCDFGR